MGAEVNPLVDPVEQVESRESERDMATDTKAGVIFETGDVKYILCCVWLST